MINVAIFFTALLTYLVRWQQVKINRRVCYNVTFTGGIKILGSVSEPIKREMYGYKVVLVVFENQIMHEISLRIGI